MRHHGRAIPALFLLTLLLIASGHAYAQEPTTLIGLTKNISVSGTSLIFETTLQLTGTGYSSTLSLQATGTLYGAITFSALSGTGNSTIIIRDSSIKLKIEGAATIGYRQESFTGFIEGLDPLGASGPHRISIDLGRSGKYEHIYVYIDVTLRNTLSLYVSAEKTGAIGTLQALNTEIPVYWTGDPGDISINPYIITTLNVTVTVVGETINGEQETLAQERIPPPISILAQGDPTVILESPTGDSVFETIRGYTRYIIVSIIGLIVIAASVYYMLNRY